jgi:signal transduction histidine kinase
MNRLGRLWTWIDRHPRLTDAGTVAVFSALALALIRVYWEVVQPVRWWVAVVLVLLLMAPLVWRRRFPLGVLAVMTAVFVVYRLVEIPDALWAANAWWLALYGAGAYGRERWRDRVRIGAIVVLFGMLVYETNWTAAYDLGGSRFLVVVVTLSANALFCAWVWWFGDVMRARGEREALLAERTMQLEREREDNARRAVLDERVRIARELHDVLAHHVSLMGVQAAAARRVLGRQPEKAEEALAAIESASRQAVAEMHLLLGVLRREDERESLAPQPSLRQLSALVGQIRDAGLPVELSVEGVERPVPPSVDLSAYRIVQEALTNTLKHAGRPARAAVKVRYGESALDIEVVDDGRGPAANGDGATAGNGLLGMRERVGMLGGNLQAGYHPGVGFSVRAHLPLEGTPA